MIRSLWTSVTGMQAQELNIDVIANNLANVNTSGFKKSRAEFQDLLYESMRPAGAASSADTTIPTGIQLGHGTRASAVQKMFSRVILRIPRTSSTGPLKVMGFSRSNCRMETRPIVAAENSNWTPMAASSMRTASRWCRK